MAFHERSGDNDIRYRARKRFPKTPWGRVELFHRLKALEGKEARLLPSPYTNTADVRPITIRKVYVFDGYNGKKTQDPKALRLADHGVVASVRYLDRPRPTYAQVYGHYILLPREKV